MNQSGSYWYHRFAESYWYQEFVFESPQFDKDQYHEADGIAGLYALGNGMEVVYVGKSKSSIGSRIREHRRNRLIIFSWFSWFDEDPEQDMAALERQAIAELEPIYNLRMGRHEIRQLAIIGKLYLRQQQREQREGDQ